MSTKEEQAVLNQIFENRIFEQYLNNLHKSIEIEICSAQEISKLRTAQSKLILLLKIKRDLSYQYQDRSNIDTRQNLS